MIAVAAEELVGNRTRCRAVEKWDGQLAVLALFHGSAPVIHKSLAVFVPSRVDGTAPARRNTQSTNRSVCAMGVFRSQSARPLKIMFFAYFLYCPKKEYLLLLCDTCSVLLCDMTYVLLPIVQARRQDGNLASLLLFGEDGRQAATYASLPPCHLAIFLLALDRITREPSVGLFVGFDPKILHGIA